MNDYAVINVGTWIVENTILWSGDENSGWSPPDGYMAVELGGASIGWTYADGVFTQPEPEPVPAPSPAEILATNTSIKNYLLAQAALSIAPLQDAVDLGSATSNETAQLQSWKQYRVAVNRMDLTLNSPTWPSTPA
ncbi:tail fiber assembly protein [Pseudomonas sp. GM18]|uniref:tail fiber assembly protein n=1 Tax=Pseudomonas sp. GM18 TaxID=1144324 RepID=UPI000A38771C|nr:tail fiber assembly protein [Pseudomonas sp. GM18]